MGKWANGKRHWSHCAPRHHMIGEHKKYQMLTPNSAGFLGSSQLLPMFFPGA